MIKCLLSMAAAAPLDNDKPLRISAKNLGAVALPKFCPRCFWIKLKLGNKLPFQTFPSIFSSIDGYTKRIVEHWFDKYKVAPKWLEGIGDLTGCIEAPHHSKFRVLIEKHNILLTGSPDAVFSLKDGTYVIADYKTARFHGVADPLYLLYEAQLNAYAYIGISCNLNPVSSLWLVYTEPKTDDDAAMDKANERADGFAMSFVGRLLEVPIDQDSLESLLTTTRSIYDMRIIPLGRLGCADCRAMNNLLNLFLPESID